MVGRCISFWDGLFSGPMLVSGRVPSAELTYPTLGKGISSSKVPLGGYMLYSSQEGAP